MRLLAKGALPAIILLVCLQGKAVTAQRNDSRSFNPMRVGFVRAWDLPLPDPVKLIEIAPVRNENQNDLMMVIGGKDSNDYQRQLRVTHWNGGQFVTDYSVDFRGLALDTLLAGRFRVPRPIPVPAALPPKDKKQKEKVKTVQGKKPAAPSTRQIVTSEGIYTWNGTVWTRLFASPPNVALALLFPEAPEQILTGSGNSAVPYEVGEQDVHPAAITDRSSGGFGRLGYGAVDTPTSPKLEYAPGIRFAQAYWSARARWFVCLLRGPLANQSDLPTTATTGDRLVVYVPKYTNHEIKSFWETQSSDLEEAWRSDPLPGRVLDVRVGDPRNEQKTGLLVLTAENQDKNRHLYFYVPANAR